jgi:methionyl-tRNA formyltransferase
MLNKILFFGNERLGTGLATTAPTLQALVSAGYNITGVVVAQNEAGKSRQARELEIVQVANQHDIPVLAPAKLSDIADDLQAMNAEAAVLVAYGKIVPQNIIDIFPKGIVNIHPSLLPKHRGPVPIESVILNGESETGVSLMRLAAKMDAGPVYAQQTIKLQGGETKQTLAGQLQQLGTSMLIQHLPNILEGSLQAVAQDDTAATYDEKISKADSELDFNQPAAQLERQVRAYAGWPRSRATIGSTEVIITAAGVGKGSGTIGSLWHEGQQIGIYCAEDVLIIDSLIPAGKKEMPASAFIAGYIPN